MSFGLGVVLDKENEVWPRKMRITSGGDNSGGPPDYFLNHPRQLVGFGVPSGGTEVGAMNVTDPPLPCEGDTVTIGPERIAGRVLRATSTEWLVEKVVGDRAEVVRPRPADGSLLRRNVSIGELVVVASASRRDPGPDTGAPRSAASSDEPSPWQR